MPKAVAEAMMVLAEKVVLHPMLQVCTAVSEGGQMCLEAESQLNGVCWIGFGPLACALSPLVRRLDLTMEQSLFPS